MAKKSASGQWRDIPPAEIAKALNGILRWVHSVRAAVLKMDPKVTIKVRTPKAAMAPPPIILDGCAPTAPAKGETHVVEISPRDLVRALDGIAAWVTSVRSAVLKMGPKATVRAKAPALAAAMPVIILDGCAPPPPPPPGKRARRAGGKKR